MMRFSAMIASVLVAACSSAPSIDSTGGAPAHIGRPEPGVSDVGRRISDHAVAMIGVPYRYGGDQPETGFDCSGLVYWSHSMSGVPVPRTSQDQFRSARKIALTEAGPGDILFFQDQEKLSHVGIYIGDRMFVHAPASGRTVSLASIDSPYYQRNLVAVGRLLR